MKGTIFLFVALLAVAITFTSFKSEVSAPKLYPELEAYFKSLNTKQFDKSHYSDLENLKYNINISDLISEEWSLIFYCSENTFRSQASQVFAQTLGYAKKHKGMRVYSAGLSAGEVSPKLIEYLIKIGYKISKSEKNGKTTYEVRFSDKAKPIILFSKTLLDNSLPVENITSVIVCDVVKETDCTYLKNKLTQFNLPFEKVSEMDNTEKVETALKNIATEMAYVTNK